MRRPAEQPSHNAGQQESANRIQLVGKWEVPSELLDQFVALNNNFEVIGAQLARTAEQFANNRNGFPENLRELRASQLKTACEIAQDEGIPMVAVPDAELTAKLVSFKRRNERVAHLLANEQRVVESCLDAVSLVEGPSKDCCIEAARAYEQGFLRASQALSSSIVESHLISLVQANENLKKSDVAGDKAKRDIGSLLYEDVLATMTTLPLVKAYTQFYPERGDPAPVDFSRHATAHRIDVAGVVASDTAIIALMLACSMSFSLWDIAA